MSGLSYREALERMIEHVAREVEPLLVRADETTGQALALIPSPAQPREAVLLVCIDPDGDTSALKIGREGVLEVVGKLGEWLGSTQQDGRP